MTRHQLELIERYLEQKMGSAEMAEFENAMLHDPLLKSEFELQKDIIESLKAYRKAEIKARLDAIQVNPAPHFANFLKIAASITITSIMIWGAYTYFNDSEDYAEKVDITSINDGFHEFHLEELPGMPLVAEANPIEEIHDVPVAKRNVRTATKKEIRFPEVRLPDIAVNFEDASPIIKDEGLPKNSHFNQLDEGALAPEILVKELPGKKNQHLYQNYDGKLYLYGNFASSPYELIELNTENGRRLFLKYDSSYYVIKPDQKNIVPLEVIQDTTLVQELQILKNNKR
jgi:hypothetical protein